MADVDFTFAKGQYQGTVRLNERVIRAATKVYNIRRGALNQFIEDAIMHYCSCPLASDGEVKGIISMIAILGQRVDRLERRKR